MWVQRRPQYLIVAERLRQPTDLHSHHALQLSLAIGAPLAAVVGGTVLPQVAGLLLGPSAPHTLMGDVLHVFVDPLSLLGRRLRGTLGQRDHLSLDPLLTRPLHGRDHDWLAAPPRAEHHELVDELLHELLRAHSRPAAAELDQRIGSVIDTLQAHLDARLPLEQLADEARLSPSRLTHLFTEQVGLPIKQYVVWLRMLAVLEAVGPNVALGALAHASGFPDQAAFNRSYRKTWGRTPSAFRRVARPVSRPLAVAAGINLF